MVTKTILPRPRHAVRPIPSGAARARRTLVPGRRHSSASVCRMEIALILLVVLIGLVVGDLALVRALRRKRDGSG